MEFLYKARRADDNEWVIGYGLIFLEKENLANIVHKHFNNLMQMTGIIPETICQYVSDYEDCEGQKCFDGDIVTFANMGDLFEGQIRYCDRRLQWIVDVNYKSDKYQHELFIPLIELSVYNTGKNIHD